MDWSRILRRRRVNHRAVHDIVARPRQRVVRLRERSWKLEISASSFARLLVRNRVRSAAALLLVLALAVGLLRGVGRANVATLYATSCLGGWASSQLAEGEPDLPPDADPELFTAKNSATLDGALAQVYCGGFRGEVPLNAAPKKVVLNLSWAVLSPGSIPELPNASPAPADLPVTVDVGATAEQQVEAILEAPEGAPAVELTESAPLPEAPVEAAPLPEPAAEVSGLPWVAVARAQEQEATEKSPDLPVEVGQKPQAETAVEALPDMGSVQPQAELPALIPVDTEPAFLEISYTIDGASWSTVAKVTAKSWRGLAVELPLESWDELATVQVALQAVPTVAEQPQVLLDSVYLAVTYDTDAAEVQPQPDFSRDTVVQLLSDGDTSLVRVFSAARQHQQLWQHQAGGAGTWTLLAEEPELDPLVPAVLHDGAAVWVTTGSGSVVAYRGGSFSSQTIDQAAEVVELPLGNGVAARWDGTSLHLALPDGQATEPSAKPLDREAFLAQLAGPATVAATATAPTIDATESDLPAAPEGGNAEPTEQVPTNPILPPEEPIVTAE